MPNRPKPKQPRDHASRAKDFGKSPAIEFHQPRTLDELVGLRHAEVQHQFSLHVKALIRGRVRQPEVAAACDFGQTRFNEVLNGRAWLSFDDMLRIEQVLGPVLGKLKFTQTPLTHPNLVGKYPTRMVPEADMR